MDSIAREAAEITPPSQDDLHASRQKIYALRKKRLPQMVNWWDASVLLMVGVRNLISATIGNYADQRPMQAAADGVPEDSLTSRHDYRNVWAGGDAEGGVKATQDIEGRWSLTQGEGTKSLAFDADGALWVDFIADLGDGFEATYAMAYLMAQPAINAEIPDQTGKLVAQQLPGGEILILGGDLAYPNATVEEYNARCLVPFNDAFQLKPGETAKRKLFFIAGNHDWYDGLAAFTSVFCTARDRFAKGKGLTIGGWQSEQRRSYFALALPHGWWFWGIDLALNETIDEAQKNYFEAMSFKTNPGEKIIIILHAPIWQNNDNSPLHEVSQWARKRGAEVVALIAGDLHFYSRFHSVNPGKSFLQKTGLGKSGDDATLPTELQLITAGGGGAFMHPTHQLPRKMKVHWTVPKDRAQLPHVGAADFKDKVATVTASDEPIFNKSRPFSFHAPHIYPSRARSMLLALKNLWLPIHNRKFALFMGFLYLVYAWVFQISTLNPTDAIRRERDVQIKTITVQCLLEPVPMQAQCLEERTAKLDENSLSTRIKKIEQRLPPLARPEVVAPARPDAAAGPTVPSVAPQTAQQGPTPDTAIPPLGRRMIDFVKKYPVVLGETAANDLEEKLSKIYEGGGWNALAWRVIWSQINTERLLYAMLSNPALFFMIVGLYWGLIWYVGFEDRDFIRPRWMKWPAKIIIGGTHAWLHILLLLSLNAVLQPIYVYYTAQGSSWPWIIFGVALYSMLLVFIGGLLGGMLFGGYWVLMSIVGKMHMDSFGALGIAGYKNFLRMKIEPDKMTIYPIGLDKVPGRKGWRALTSKDDTSGHNPLIKPKQPLRPHLIEMPYEIKAPLPPGRAARI